MPSEDAGGEVNGGDRVLSPFARSTFEGVLGLRVTGEMKGSTWLVLPVCISCSAVSVARGRLRRRLKRTIASSIQAIAATPPTTPPTMALVFEDFDGLDAAPFGDLRYAQAYYSEEMMDL